VSSGNLKDRIAALLLLAAVVLAISIFVVRPLWARYSENSEAVASLQENISRFERIATQFTALKKELVRQNQALDLREYTLQGVSATLAAASLQERVKSFTEAAGGSLVSTQVLESEPVGEFQRVSVKVRMSGSTAGLQKSLHALESGKPILVIDDLLVTSRQTTSRRRGQEHPQLKQLDVQYRVSGFYENEPARE